MTASTKSATELYTYQTAETVAEWMVNDESQNGFKFAIIDVRDVDFGPNKLINAMNFPSNRINEKKLHQISNKTKDCHKIIFHCAYSQCRGPTAAKKYALYRKKNAKKYKSSEFVDQEIIVLQGGFLSFYKEYKNLCESVSKI